MFSRLRDLTPVFVALAVLAACGGRDVPVPPQEEAEGHAESLDQAKRLAAERGVPVLIDFWSPT